MPTSELTARPSVLTPEIKDAYATLAALDAEALRPILSQLVNKTPNVVYWPHDYLNFSARPDGKANGKMDRIQQAGLFCATAVARELVPEGITEIKMKFGSVSHNGENGPVDHGDWEVTIRLITPEEFEAD